MNKAYELARKDMGTWEWAEGHNPVVLKYFQDAGHPSVVDDETSWCAAFVGAMLERSGLKSTRSLTARSYLQWGEPTLSPKKGDIVVFWRGSKDSWQGHVAFFEEFQGVNVLCLGGNQRNQVNISPFSKDKVLGYRTHSSWSGTPAVETVEVKPDAAVVAPAKPQEAPKTWIFAAILAVLALLGISFAN